MSSNILEFATTIIIIIIIIIKYTRSRKLQHVLNYIICVLYHARLYLKFVYRPKHVALLRIVEYKKNCFLW
jgi:hypothetical protein